MLDDYEAKKEGIELTSTTCLSRIASIALRTKVEAVALAFFTQ
jgi:hypothetical protein